MATVKRRWTNEEEQVLISQVRQNPNNLSRAFRNASNITGRSPHSCEQRWYTKIRNTETVFMTIGARNMSVNSKVSNNPQPVRLSIWKRILKILGLSK